MLLDTKLLGRRNALESIIMLSRRIDKKAQLMASRLHLFMINEGPIYQFYRN